METEADLELSKITSWLGSDPSKLFARLQNEEWYINPQFEWINSLNIQTKNRILEVGTGPGQLARYAQEQYKCDVVAVDSSQKMLEKAEESKVKFVKADAEDIPFENEGFDLVFSSSLLNIVSNPEKVLSEMFRLSKKGAHISFLIPSENMNISNAQIFARENHLKEFSKAVLLFWAKNAKILSNIEIQNILNKIGYIGNIQEKYFFDNMLLSSTLEK